MWLPNWPITRLDRQRAPGSDEIRVTTEFVLGVRRLAAVGTKGIEAGLRRGQTLTDARTVCPKLVSHDADPESDQAALTALAAWCERYTPLVAPDPPSLRLTAAQKTDGYGLWLDITGCTHLFGGEPALIQHLRTRLTRDKIACRLAVAGTTGVAWAVARGPSLRDVTILQPDEEAAALTHLPVAMLRLEPRVLAELRRLGLHSVGELARLPRSEITARFGPTPVLQLDHAFGVAEEAIAWPHPLPPIVERLAFVEPIGTLEDLSRAIDLLLIRLCQKLADRDQGGHRFVIRFFRVSDGDQHVTVATALPTRETGHLGKLFYEKLETVDPGFGVEAIALEAEQVAPLGMVQKELLAPPDLSSAVAKTVDTLVSRLGPKHIWRAAPRESHLPERAVTMAPWAAAPAWASDHCLPRPVRLLRRPEPIEATAPVPDDPPILFRWRGVVYWVRAASGPERIGIEWWRGREPADDRPQADRIRDYYRVEDTTGIRFWIFRAGLQPHRNPGWYLHGLFG